MDSCEGGETKHVVDGDKQAEVCPVDQGLNPATYPRSLTITRGYY